MANTYAENLIGSVTVGAGGQSSIVFSSIPQTYADLLLVTSLRSSNGNSDLALQFNAISTNYSWIQVYGTGSTVSADTLSSQSTLNRAGRVNPSTTTANTFSSNEIYIPNYTGSTSKYVSVDGLYEDNATAVRTTIIAGTSASGSAVSTITLTIDGGGNFTQYSTAYLYGITSVANVAKATGGVITYDSTYVYHTFTSSGTFTPLQSLTVDYLVVAGGGAGGGGTNSYGNNGGGGGGAGGFRTSAGPSGGGASAEAALSLSAQAYTVTVGAGGAAYTWIQGNNGTTGADGSNSVFGSITSIGGGGGAYPYGAGRSGGSGSGAGAGYPYNVSGGAGTSGQGYAGGKNNGDGTAGGGGGAGSVGGTGTTNIGGNGGSGVASSITGSSVTYAGGGGGCSWNTTGSSGGSGGGGAGASNTYPRDAISGTTNTGSGGGGGGYVNGGFIGYPGSGGSGIVIVRYAR